MTSWSDEEDQTGPAAPLQFILLPTHMCVLTRLMCSRQATCSTCLHRTAHINSLPGNVTNCCTRIESSQFSLLMSNAKSHMRGAIFRGSLLIHDRNTLFFRMLHHIDSRIVLVHCRSENCADAGFILIALAFAQKSTKQIGMMWCCCPAKCHNQETKQNNQKSQSFATKNWCAPPELSSSAATAFVSKDCASSLCSTSSPLSSAIASCRHKQNLEPAAAVGMVWPDGEACLALC